MELDEKWPRSWDKNWPKPVENLSKCWITMSWFHGLISSNISIFWTSNLRDKVVEFINIYNFHVEIFPWIILHHGEKLSWSIEVIKVKNTWNFFKSLKSWLFVDFFTFLILDDQVLYFWMSWWILIFEIQCWSKSQSLTFVY